VGYPRVAPVGVCGRKGGVTVSRVTAGDLEAGYRQVEEPLLKIVPVAEGGAGHSSV
jgi:hypothetical protein